MSGWSASIAPIRVCSSFCVASRSDLWTKLMTNVALRGSAAPPPSSWPPKMSAERTSGMARSLSEIARVTRSVSSSREPGGSSTASSTRPRSSAGMKPDGSSLVDQSEAAKISAPTNSVIQRWRTEARTSRV